MTIIRDAAGQPVRTVATIENISERKRWVETLRESELFANAVVDALSAQLAILSDDGTIIAVNKSWRAFATANSPAESTLNVCEGANYLAVCESASGPDSEEAVAMADGIRAVMSGKQTEFLLEYPCHSPNKERWFTGRVTRFSGDGDRRVVIVHDNITERKRAEALLLHEQALYKDLLNTIPPGVYRLRMRPAAMWNEQNWRTGRAYGRQSPRAFRDHRASRARRHG